MQRFGLALSILLICISARADKASDIKSEKVFSSKGSDSLPTPRRLNILLKEAGFGPEVMDLDQADKDSFYSKVKSKDVEYLKQRYPYYPVEKIKKFKAIVEKEAK